jgi:hypothetical protein
MRFCVFLDLCAVPDVIVASCVSCPGCVFCPLISGLAMHHSTEARARSGPGGKGVQHCQDGPAKSVCIQTDLCTCSCLFQAQLLLAIWWPCWIEEYAAGPVLNVHNRRSFATFDYVSQLDAGCSYCLDAEGIALLMPASVKF